MDTPARSAISPTTGRGGGPAAGRSHLAWGGLAAVAAAVVHLPGLANGFVNWDDYANLVDNQAFRGLSRRSLGWMWTTRHLGVYEPLAWMLKSALHAAFGLTPAAFHAASVVLHGMNVFLVFVIARRLVAVAGRQTSAMPWAALLAALLFGVHPLRVESVAWASAQPYLLSSSFALLSVWAYLRAAGAAGRRSAWFYLSVAMYVCSLLSKTAALPLPAVLVVLDVHPLRRVHREPLARWAAEKLWFLVPGGVVVALTVSAPVISVIPDVEVGFAQRLATACFGLSFYVWKSFWPAGLTAFQPFPTPWHWSPRFLAAALFTVGVAGVALGGRRRAPALVAALTAYLLFLAPVLGLVRHGDQIAADRYSYLACIGLTLVAAAWLARRGLAARAVAIASCLALSALTVRQTRTWRDSRSLWEHALAVDPHNWLALSNLANAYLEIGDAAKARPLAEASLGILPAYPDGLATLANCLVKEGRTAEALPLYQRALDLVPFHSAALSYIAALRSADRLREAADVCERSLRADPTRHTVRYNHALLLIELRRFEEAERSVRALAMARPDDPASYHAAGLLDAAVDRLDAARGAFEHALRLDPLHGQARERLARVLWRTGRREEAVAAFRRHVTDHPGDVEAQTRLADALLGMGRVAEAVEGLSGAMAARPDEPRIANKLAWLLATSGDVAVRDPPRALALAETLSRRFENGNADALDTLAAALAAVGRFDEAAEAAERAERLARQRGDVERADGIARRGALYRARQALRE